MSRTRRTPWQAELDDVPYDGGFETWVVNTDGAGICMMDCPKDEMERNARLIAAAPELLEACEDIESKIVDFQAGRISWRPDDFLHRVRAAIAKAKGEVE